jgi:hypothetical protein
VPRSDGGCDDIMLLGGPPLQNDLSNNLPPAIPVVPIECGGRWIAWNFEGTQILAVADELAEAERIARSAGENRPRLEKVPRSDVRIVGGARR